MTIFGCTGHQNLDLPTQLSVAAEIFSVFLAEDSSSIEGVCNLAKGADQLFAFAILAAGGTLYSIIPCEMYRKTFIDDPVALDRFACLSSISSKITVLNFEEPSEDAFLSAGIEAANYCDVLIAVWDGRGSAGKGGTADIVTHARSLGKKVVVVWPPGAKREQ